MGLSKIEISFACVQIRSEDEEDEVSLLCIAYCNNKVWYKGINHEHKEIN